MSDGPRIRPPVEIKEGDDGPEGEEEISRPTRPARSARPPKVGAGPASRRSEAPPQSQRRDSAPSAPPRRSKTPRPPSVTPPPPATASKARLTPKPPRTSARPPAVAAKAAPTKSDARPKAKTTRSRKTPAPPEVRLGSHAEGFFAEGEAKAAEAHEDDARLPVNSIFAPAERPEMAKFVMIALALCAAIAVFALVRALTAPPPPPHESLVPPDVPSAAPSPIPPVPALAAVQPSATPSTAASAVAVSDASAPMLAASASPADLTLDGGAPLVAVGTKTASEEKIDARKALERGKSKDAVEAASRSIALDPTDADAWLILGAANMELGKSADAHTAFAACAKEATKGPIGECRSMLR